MKTGLQRPRDAEPRLGPTVIRFTLALLTATCAIAIAGCNTTEPELPTQDTSRVTLDPEEGPDTGTIRLKTVLAGPPDRPVRLALLGHDVRSEAPNLVSVDVCIANESDHALYADVLVWLSAFTPMEVMPANADLIPPASEDHFPLNPVWGFAYTELLGEDGVLSPGEISAAKTWTFIAPDLTPFSFGANIQFTIDPPSAAHIGGLIFMDANVNGALDPDEGPFASGTLTAHGPEGYGQETNVGPDGRYVFHVQVPGLYTIQYFAPELGAPFSYGPTTPNPLEVLVAPGPDGMVRSFDAADFGLQLVGIDIPPVQLTDLPPQGIEQDPYHLTTLDLDGPILRTRIGFSGCSPGHPLQLFVSGGFMESLPVQARLVLMHDDLGEFCDAFFEVERAWDLTPIAEAYRQAYGRLGDTVVLHLETPNGDQHQILFRF